MTTIALDTIEACGNKIGSTKVDLGNDITAEIKGQTLYLYQRRSQVFDMAVQIHDGNLELDRPVTEESQRNRGWGRLGLLLALFYGRANGATTVSTGTFVEDPIAFKFWGGIQKTPHDLQQEIVRRTSPPGEHITIKCGPSSERRSSFS